MVRAIITGITGQDGSLLASKLLKKNYEVIGITRQKTKKSLRNLKKLKIEKDIQLIEVDLLNRQYVKNTLDKFRKLDFIYNFAGQSSVSSSFHNPNETFISNTRPVLNFLDIIAKHYPYIRFYNSSSGEVYGDTGGVLASEKTKFRPTSPYGIAKQAAYEIVANYRKSYNIFCVSGILFNHESALRSSGFLIRKLIDGILEIKLGKTKTLELGNLEILRDWGYAPEYVEAIDLITKNNFPEDFIVSTGKPHSLTELLEKTFSYHDLNWTDHVVSDNKYIRKQDPKFNAGDPSKIYKAFGWKAQVDLDEMIKRIFEVV